MKRPIAMLLCLVLTISLYAACSEKKEAAEPPFVFTRGNLPRLDGSTSTVPLALAVCAEVLGESREDVQDLVHFNKTTTAYFNLLEGDADLLIVGEANGEVMARKEELDFEWEKQPFATDAFVFVVNEDNPVDSITVAQARDIYAGKITNWSELGGEDRPITALQRNEGAGSQTLMEKLVMQGTPMMDAPTEYIVATMGQLMEAVKSFDGSPGAIGYSVYYYAEEMKMAQGLKLLKLEGVEPNPDTIRSETYPLVNPKYVVIPAGEPKNAPNRVLFDWLLSEEGQTLIAKEGYVSILDVGTYPKTAPQVGTRLSEGYMGELKASDGYGLLVPYAGRRLMDDWPAATGCVYGLMTLDGVAVTDAVYSNVYYPSYYENYERYPLPVLVLMRGQASDSADGFETYYTVAASDGSWIMEESYRALSASRYGLLLFGGDALTVTDTAGSVTQRISYQEMGLSGEEADRMISEMMWGEGTTGTRRGGRIALGWADEDNCQNIRYYDLSTGERGEMAWEAFYDPEEDNTDDYEKPVYAVENANPVVDEALGSDAPGLLSVYDADENGVVLRYYREDGTPIESLTMRGEKWYRQVALRGGLIEVLDLNTASYYDLETMDCVFETCLGYEAD